MRATISPIALQLAEVLHGMGVYLEPKKNSIFEGLVEELCEPVKNTEVESVESWASNVNDIFANARPSIFKMGNEDINQDPDEPMEIGIAYDAILAPTIKEVSTVASGVAYSVNNVVLPAIREIFDNTIEAINDKIETGAIKCNVVTDKSECAIWSNPMLISLLGDKSTGTDSKDARLGGDIQFEDPSTEFLMGCLQTGNDLLDAEINEYLDQFAKQELVEHTFHEIFAKNERGVYKGQGQEPENLVAFLMARYLAANIPDGCVGAEHEEYMRLMYRVANYYGGEVSRYIAIYSHHCQIRRLVVESALRGSEFNEGATIVVNGRLYNEYLEKGGNVDALLGNNISENSDINLDRILEKQSQLMMSWANHISYAQAKLTDNFQRTFSVEIRNQIMKHAAANNLKVDVKKVDEILFERDYPITKANAFDIACKVVVKSLYPNEEFLLIIRNMNALAEQFKDITKETLFELALIDWLVDWALTHLNIGK